MPTTEITDLLQESKETQPENEKIPGANEENSNNELIVQIDNKVMESAAVTEDTKDLEAMKVQLDNLADSSTLLLVGILLLFSAREMMLVGQIHFVRVRARHSFWINC